jgi:hypothetical protein
MPDDERLRQDLLARIDARRSAVREFLRANQPTIRRRTTVALVLSSLAALFTAGPALGGENFSGAVQASLGLRSDSTVWRVLCLAALVVSLGAAVSANLGKSQEAAVQRLTAAEAARAGLDGLATLLQFGQLAVDDAAKLYQQYCGAIPFVDDGPVHAAAQPAPARVPAPRPVPPAATEAPPTASFPLPPLPRPSVPPTRRVPPPPPGRQG